MYVGQTLDEKDWYEWFNQLAPMEREVVREHLLLVPEHAPNPGPQTLAYKSPAFFTGFGGAAGGGKSALLALLVLHEHTRSVLFRQNANDLSSLIDTIQEFYGSAIGRNNQEKVYRFADRAGHMCEWGGLEKPNSETNWQGRAHDFVGVDEMALLAKAKIDYVTKWCRTNIPGQRTRILGTFNPPGGMDGMSIVGMWVLDYFSAWLNERHPNPAKYGEVRHFLPSEDPGRRGKEDEVDPAEWNGQPVMRTVGDMVLEVMPKSRTFIRSRVADNPKMNPEYISTLYSDPNQLTRERLLEGKFSSSMIEQDRQVLPTSWIEAAMDRWTPAGRFRPMTSQGIDVAMGGNANSVFSNRHEWWWDRLHQVEGHKTKLGSDIVAVSVARNREGVPVCVDANGVGAAAYSAFMDRGLAVIPCKGQEKRGQLMQQFRDIGGPLVFYNLRAALHWTMRLVLDPDTGLEPELPPDDDLKQELMAPQYMIQGNVCQIEGKDLVKAKLQRSPDNSDSVINSLANVFVTDGWHKLLPKHKREELKLVEYSQRERRDIAASTYLQRGGDLRGFPLRTTSWMAR